MPTIVEYTDRKQPENLYPQRIISPPRSGPCCFSDMEEIGELLKLEDGARCSEARQLAEQKLVDVRQKLSDLQRIESVLTGLVARCSAVRGRVNCPLIASLQEVA